MLIRKANGSKVSFDKKKVETTCIRAGVTRNVARHISSNIAKQIFSGIDSSSIYKMVLRELSFEDQGIKHRYRLKEAIMLMGPMGFPFEIYISKILENYGHKINSIGKKFSGHCALHEIDISTRKKNQRYMIECKYHNASGKYTGLKESLYTHARYLDLKAKFEKEILVSNTKVSFDAIKYAKCVGQEILCWRYPQNNGLEKMIEKKNLYPITVLHIFRHEIPQFAHNGIMLIQDLVNCSSSQLSKKTKISTNRIQRLQKISEQILR